MMASHRRAHRRIWAVLALLLPAILISALLLRRDPSSGAAAVQIEPGQGRLR
ncbi:MAG: hypothetical protein NW217_06030 [Hyphomicrobiaceae bacterium]|nr:hypothetical protein [Hyphomicrobiaceae bacterium]